MPIINPRTRKVINHLSYLAMIGLFIYVGGTHGNLQSLMLFGAMLCNYIFLTTLPMNNPPRT